MSDIERQEIIDEREALAAKTAADLASLKNPSDLSEEIAGMVKYMLATSSTHNKTNGLSGYDTLHGKKIHGAGTARLFNLDEK